LSARDRALDHEFKLAAGTTFLIELHSTDFNAHLKLLDAHGKLLAEHGDIAPEKRDARLIFAPKEDGTFRIVTASLQPSGTGAYTLTIRTIAGKAK
jgi:hypothetical protein